VKEKRVKGEGTGSWEGPLEEKDQDIAGWLYEEKRKRHIYPTLVERARREQKEKEDEAR
jgi:hypothetical protein